MRLDHKKLREGIVNGTIAWAAIENSMAVLLHEMLGRGGTDVASAIYFAPNNIETRFRIVDAVFKLVNFSTHNVTALRSWSHLYNAIGRAKKTRNKIIHGNITTVYARGQNYARLTAPLFDFATFKKQHDAGQLLGMSAHDVERAVENFWSISTRLNLFIEAVSALNRGDNATLREKLRELE